MKIFRKIRKIWCRLNGDEVYERYLTHWQMHEHAPDEQPLDRKAFFADETQRKWSGVKRCC